MRSGTAGRAAWARAHRSLPRPAAHALSETLLRLLVTYATIVCRLCRSGEATKEEKMLMIAPSGRNRRLQLDREQKAGSPGSDQAAQQE